MLALADDVTTVNFRIPRSDRDAFWEKASAYGTPSHVLRELVMAYIDGRLTIKPRTIEIQ